MTVHDETNDPIDAALGDAGQRLRRQAPDSVASRQALARVTERAAASTTGRRSWWPALIGAGLAAAAVVGVVAIRADDNETPTVTPVIGNGVVIDPGVLMAELAGPRTAGTAVGLGLAIASLGVTLGPPIFGTSNPLAASAVSRTISASMRNRGPRASSRFCGSRCSSSAVVRELC